MKPDFDAIAKSITDEVWRAYGPTQTQRIAVALAEAWLVGVDHGREQAIEERDHKDYQERPPSSR